jgi:hypothetical protein
LDVTPQTTSAKAPGLPIAKVDGVEIKLLKKVQGRTMARRKKGRDKREETLPWRDQR